MFVVGGTTFTESGGAAVGSAQVWEVNLSSCKPEKRLVVQIAEAGLPNGFTKADNHHVLVADSTMGVIYKLNENTGNYSIALSDPETMAIPEDAEITVGVNGINILNDYVYYTNTARQAFSRIPVDKQLNAVGPTEYCL